MRYTSVILFGSVFGCSLALAGCARAPADPPAAGPIPVAVSYPIEREVTDYADFTARTAAVDSVEVRSRVWGYLKKVNFTEGTLVKKGDVLFELDPRPYQADYDRSLANLTEAKAHLARTSADFKRAEDLLPKNAIAQKDYDLAKGDRDEAGALVKMAEAAVNTATLNLSFTKIVAPISGRISRYLVTVGNLIQSGDQANVTLLTTIVSVDPMYAYFDVDEGTVPRVRQLIRAGRGRSAREAAIPVMLGLANEEGFPHRGTIDFIDNQVNPKTGTLRLRATFPNRGETLLPGLFARVRVPIGLSHRALLVSDRAVDNDQGLKVLYVVNNKNQVVSHPIRVGLLHDGLRAIEDGLKPGERVVINGLQTVRSGITVEPKLLEMPRSNARSEDRRSRQIQVSQSP